MVGNICAKGNVYMKTLLAMVSTIFHSRISNHLAGECRVSIVSQDDIKPNTGIQHLLKLKIRYALWTIYQNRSSIRCTLYVHCSVHIARHLGILIFMIFTNVGDQIILKDFSA